MADDKKTEDKKIDKANDAAASIAPLDVKDIKAATQAEPPHPNVVQADPGHAAPKDAHAGDQSATVVNRLADKLDELQNKIRPTGPAGPTAGLNKSVPGGRFLVQGKLVDCHGRELNDDGGLKYPERQTVDAFGRVI